jgi:hypothetical protein
MKKTVVGAIIGVVFLVGLVVGIVLQPERVVAAVGSVQSWGLVEDPSGQPRNVLVLFDSSTGEIWGYPEKGGLRGTPVRIGVLTKVGAPLGK